MHILPLIVWTILVWLAPALAAWTMLQAMDLHLPLTAGWTVLAFVGLSVSIPSAPGYVGIFHYAAVLALEIFGVTRATWSGTRSSSMPRRSCRSRSSAGSSCSART